MQIDKEGTEQYVIEGLSKLIKYHLTNAAYQQYTPDSDADKSDSTIADAKGKAVTLRRLREEFETVVTGIIVPF